MRRTLPLYILLFLSLNFHLANCQDGNFFLRHYSNYIEGIDNYNWSIQQGNDKVMYFANTRGIIAYDGAQWKLTKTLKTPLALLTDFQTGNLYVGFINEIGYFASDHKGHLIYTRIACPVNQFEEITKIISTDHSIFFCNTKVIIQVDKKSQQYINSINFSDSQIFLGCFSFQNKLFVNIENTGLHEYKDQSLSVIKNGAVFGDCGLSFGVLTNSSQLIIGTTKNELFNFDGVNFKKFIPDGSSYLKETILTDAIFVSEQDLAISTLAGGCIIINILTGKTVSILNYQSGLPDNEIYSLGKDSNGGLWMAHEYGVTRLDTHIPVKEYSSYPGLDGHVLGVLNHKNTLYVATSEGVFYLAKSLPHELRPVKLEERKKSVTPAIATTPNTHYNRISLKKTFHFNLLRKKNEQKNDLQNEIANVETAKKIIKKKDPAYPNTYFEFKKIEKISGKCKQIIAYNNRILVASTKGLFEIVNFKGNAIIKELNIHFLYPSKGQASLFVSSGDKLYRLEENKHTWIKNIFLENSLAFHSIGEDYTNTLWLGGNGKVVRVQLSERNKIIDSKTYLLPEAQNENIQVKIINKEVCFLSSNGIYNYNRSTNDIYRDSCTNKFEDKVFQYVSCQNDYAWIKSDSGWVKLEETSDLKEVVSILSLVQNIHRLFVDSESNIWVVDKNNNLYKLKANYKNLHKPFNVHIREVKNNQGHHLSLQNLNLDYENNSLKFFLAAPFYVGEDHIHYQYYLEGVTKDWSVWTNDHKIELTYLPGGNYNLVLRAKNVFGQLTETRSFPFKIYPPYWRTTWFFLLEFLFFISLLIISIVLNRNQQSGFFTKAITFLTLIITMEFVVFYIESMITFGNSPDPFIRFGINVLLALLISPFEKALELVLSKRKRSIVRLLLFLRKKIATQF